MVTAVKRIDAKQDGQPAVDFSRENPLRVEEVASMFHVHRRTVENWFSRGLFYFRMEGSRIRYTTREALSRFARPCSAAVQVSSDDAATREAEEAREVLRTRFGF